MARRLRGRVRSSDWGVADFTGAADAAYIASELPNVPTALRTEFATAANNAASAMDDGTTGREVIDELAAVATAGGDLYWLSTSNSENYEEHTSPSTVSTDGNPIGWADGLLNGKEAIQATSTAKPTAESAAPSHGVYDGGDWLGAANFAPVSYGAHGFIIVFEESLSAGTRPIGLRSAASGGNYTEVTLNTNGSWYYDTEFSGSLNRGQLTAAETVVANTPMILTAYTKSSGSDNKIQRTNGSNVGTTTITASDTLTDRNLGIGANGYGFGSISGKVWAGLAVYGSAVDTLNWSALEHFLDQLTGVSVL